MAAGQKGVFSFILVVGVSLYLLYFLQAETLKPVSLKGLHGALESSTVVSHAKSNVDALYDQAIEDSILALPKYSPELARLAVAQGVCSMAMQFEEAVEGTPLRAKFYFAQAAKPSGLLSAAGEKVTVVNCVPRLLGLVSVNQVSLEQAMAFPEDAPEAVQLALLFNPSISFEEAKAKTYFTRVTFNGGLLRNEHFYAVIEMDGVRQAAALVPGYSILVTPKVLLP